MSNRVLIHDLAIGVAKRANISEQEAEIFIRNVFDIISDQLDIEKVIKVRNLGTFKLVEVEERETLDAATGNTVRIKGYKKILFTPDNALKDSVNKPFAQFETVVLNDDTDLDEMEKIEEVAAEETEEDVVDENMEETSADSDFVEENSLEEDFPKEANQAEPLAEFSSEPQSEISSDEGETAEPVSDEPAEVNLFENEEEIEESDNNDHIESHEDEITEDNQIASEIGLETSENKEQDFSSSSSSETSKNEDSSSSSTITPQIAEYQKVQQQFIDDLTVSSQHIEHQTIEHQSIVHQEKVQDGKGKNRMTLSLPGVMGLLVLVVALMIGSYIAGYHHLLCFCSLTGEDTPEQVEEQPVQVQAEDMQNTSLKPSDKVVAADTLAASVDATPKQAEEKQTGKQKEAAALKETAKPKVDSVQIMNTLREKAKNYAQVENGQYLIVGIKKEHILKSGENLLRIAQRTYGSKNFLPYILKVNQIENPDLVQIGQVILLPELVKNDK